MQSWGKYLSSSDIDEHTYCYNILKNKLRMVKSDTSEHSRTHSIPISSTVQPCVWVSCLKVERLLQSVYIQCASFLSPSVSYLAWPPLADNVTPLSSRCTLPDLIQYLSEVCNLWARGTKLKVSHCLCMCTEASSAVRSSINTGIQNKCWGPCSSLHAWACWYRLLFG